MRSSKFALPYYRTIERKDWSEVFRNAGESVKGRR
jgi:hypothetical protein